MRKRNLAYLALLGNVLIWGAALPIVKPALGQITPFHFLELRYWVASVCLLPILIYFWPKKNAGKTLTKIIAIETIQVLVSLTLLYLGLQSTQALTASLVSSAAPIFVTLGGILILKEREENREWLGLTLSLLGTAVIILSPNLFALYAPLSIGVLYLCGYLAANTLYLLAAKRHYQRENKLFITAVSSLLGLLGFTLLAPFMGSHPAILTLIQNADVVRAVAFMGILGTPVAMSLLLYGQSKIEASEAALFTYLQPLIYIPLSVFWLGDKVELYQMSGLFLICLGVFIAEKRTSKHPKR